MNPQISGKSPFAPSEFDQSISRKAAFSQENISLLHIIGDCDLASLLSIHFFYISTSFWYKLLPKNATKHFSKQIRFLHDFQLNENKILQIFWCIYSDFLRLLPLEYPKKPIWQPIMIISTVVTYNTQNQTVLLIEKLKSK